MWLGEDITEVQTISGKALHLFGKKTAVIAICLVLLVVVVSLTAYYVKQNQEKKDVLTAIQNISKEDSEPESEDTVLVVADSNEQAIKIEGSKAVAYVKYTVTKKDGTVTTSVRVVNFTKNEQTGEWEVTVIEDFNKDQYDEELLGDLCADSANQLLEECKLVDDRPEPECQKDADCDDGIYCTKDDYCDKGQCRNVNSPCSQDKVCSEVLKSCVDCLGGSDCNDNLFCSTDTCENNHCYHSFDVCTDQYCNEETNECQIIECRSVADCPEDGLYCNGTITCQESHCVSVPPIECPDDGLYCNGSETREESQSQCNCVHQGSPCAQGLICDEVKDSCVECLSNLDCQDKDDGLFCNGESICILGQCVESGDPCQSQQKQCDEENNRCVSCFENSNCDLGQNCYVYTCQQDGSCSSELKDCEAGQMCNFDNGICETIKCQTDADCSDDNACTYESCNLDLNSCENTGEKICDDSNLCTIDRCDTQSGQCMFEDFYDEGLSCQGGVCQQCFSDPECNEGDLCKLYSCQNGDCYSQPKNCGAGKICEAGTGNCIEIACQIDGDCDIDNNVCTLEECNTQLNQCQSAGQLDCLGSDPCKIYSCDPASGCQETNKCPTGKMCNAGLCVNCLSDNDCDQTDPCNPQICTIYGACQANYKCDGQACTLTGQCVPCTQDSHCPNLPCRVNIRCVNNSCVSDNRDCSDGDACTTDYCDENTNQCVYSPLICYDPRFQCQSGVCVCQQDSDCNDGLYCNGAETCISGMCSFGTNPCPVGSSCVENTDRCIEACEEQGQTANETCLNIHTFSWRECSSQLEWEDKTSSCLGSVDGTAKFNSTAAASMGWFEVEHIADEGGQEIRWLEYSKGDSKITLRSYNLQNNTALYQIAQQNPQIFPTAEVLNNLKTDTILNLNESITGQTTVVGYSAAYIQQGSNHYYKDIALVATACNQNICHNWKDLYVRIFLSNINTNLENEVIQIINTLTIE